MSRDIWVVGGQGGNWTNSADWSTGEQPGSSSSVLLTAPIGVPTSVEITGNVGTVASVSNETVLLLGNGGALTVSGSLTNTGDLDAGYQLGKRNSVTATGGADLTIDGALVNIGSFEAYASSIVAGALDNAEFLTFDDSADGGASLTIGGAATNSGNLTIDSANASAGSLSNSGTINLEGTSSLTVSGAATNSGAVTIGGNSQLTVTGAAYTQSAGTTTVYGTLDAPVIADGGTFTFAIGSALEGPSLELSRSTTTLTVADSLTYTGAVTIDARSDISISSGDTLSFTGSVSNNGGTVVDASGTLDFAGAVSGKGKYEASGAGSTVEFDSTVSSGQTFVYSNAGGVLDLTDPTAFDARISGFASGDSIDLAGSWLLTSVSENKAGTISTLDFSNGTNQFDLILNGSYALSDFNVQPGSSNNTIVSHS
jgi:fibronectin-binding autotransporter adhesin